jgi:hypothetical protein
MACLLTGWPWSVITTAQSSTISTLAARAASGRSIAYCYRQLCLVMVRRDCVGTVRQGLVGGPEMKRRRPVGSALR